MPDKLPILPTARDAYAFVWRHRRRFFSLAFPAVVILSIPNAFVLLAPKLAGGDDGWNLLLSGKTFVGLVSILAVVEIAFYVVFSVAWHRRYLVPGDATTVREALRWRRRQTGFLLRFLALSALMLLVWLITAGVFALYYSGNPAESGIQGSLALVSGIFAPVVILTSYLYARLLPLLPATAVDHRMSFRACFELTRGNGWRLVFIIAVVGIPIWIFSGIAQMANIPLFATGTLSGSLVAALVGETLTFIGIAVGVSALSIAYERLMAGGGRSQAGHPLEPVH